MGLKYKTTKDISVSKSMVEQVIGQDEAVKIIKKSAKQRRHVLLIGDPGTGKSMLGLALAELLPKEKLVDVLSFANPNDENAPIIRAVPAGQGREIVTKSKVQNMGMFKNQNILFIVFALISVIVPYYFYSKKMFPFDSPIIYAASMVTSVMFLVGLIMMINMTKRMGGGKTGTPKVIVDNFGGKQAPFFDATGAHAGALLGDVLHDPFQCYSGVVTFNGLGKENITTSVIDSYFDKNKSRILRREERNYESIFFRENEITVLGENNGSFSPVDVLSSNRHDHDGQMIKLTTFENKELIVTLEHKIALWKKGKIEYVEAQNIKEGDSVVAKSEDIIIDEQDIINTYDARQQEQCRLYYQYLDIKSKNPSWGYKRIAKSMGQPIGKTRWWHAGKHVPVPIQTAILLKEKGLIPLTLDNPKLSLISKVLGATFGDGGIFENLNGIFLSSSEKDAVEEFGRDTEKIFGLKLDENSRIIEGGEYGHSWCYQNANRNVIRFFIALGAPVGKKTHLELKVPQWLYLKQELIDQYYFSFLGSELGSPSQHKDKNRLTGIEIGISSTPALEKNRFEFLNELAHYLKLKGIKTNSIYKGKVHDSDNFIYRLQLSTMFDNVIKFLIELQINYCSYKVDRLYLSLGKWAAFKKDKYEELLQRGYGAEHAMKTLKLTPNSLYLLLNHFGDPVET